MRTFVWIICRIIIFVLFLIFWLICSLAFLPWMLHLTILKCWPVLFWYLRNKTDNNSNMIKATKRYISVGRILQNMIMLCVYPVFIYLLTDENCVQIFIWNTELVWYKFFWIWSQVWPLEKKVCIFQFLVTLQYSTLRLFHIRYSL